MVIQFTKFVHLLIKKNMYMFQCSEKKMGIKDSWLLGYNCCRCRTSEVRFSGRSVLGLRMNGIETFTKTKNRIKQISNKKDSCLFNIGLIVSLGPECQTSS